MEKQNKLNAKKTVARIATAALIWMICLALTGCGKRIVRIEQNQFELQELIRLNTQLMTDNMKQIEEKQNQLHVSIEDVQQTNQKHADNVKAAITQEHAAFQDLLQIQNQRLINSLAEVERSQGSLNSGIAGLNANIRQTNESTSGLEKEMLQIQQSLQNNNKEMANLMDVIGQRQLRSDERTQENIQGIVGTIKDVLQSQARLQEQIIVMQDNDKEAGNKIIAALEQMKVTLSQMQVQISTLLPAKSASVTPDVNK